MEISWFVHLPHPNQESCNWCVSSKFPRPKGGAFLKTLKQFQLSPLFFLMMPNVAPNHFCRHLVPHRAGKVAVFPQLACPQLLLELRKFLKGPTRRDTLQDPHDLGNRVSRRK